MTAVALGFRPLPGEPAGLAYLTMSSILLAIWFHGVVNFVAGYPTHRGSMTGP